jgi:hypothetical protein
VSVRPAPRKAGEVMEPWITAYVQREMFQAANLEFLRACDDLFKGGVLTQL